MKAEQLISKGVSKKFDGQQVWFSVESLKKHYKGLQYHESDVDAEGYLRASDIFGDDIQELKIEVTPEAVLEIEVTAEILNDNPELKAEGIEIGETITVDVVEPSEKVVLPLIEKEMVAPKKKSRKKNSNEK